MSFIDTHCHPYLNKIKSESEIINNFKKSGGKYMICIGVDIESSKKAIELSKKYSEVYATIGIHPCDSIKYKGLLNNTISELESLYNNNKEKVIGIGECGLDYFHTKKTDTENINIQKDFFEAQINLAKKINLPIIIHNRDSKYDVIDILKKNDMKNFIMHCFAENLDYAKDLISFSSNCMISFSGIVTFNSAKDIQIAATKIPLKNILVETDSPYLTPTPYRGKQENEPSFTKYVLEKIVDLRLEDSNAIRKQILENSLNIFKLKK